MTESEGTHNYFDIHSHLNLPQFDLDREDVIFRMKEAGIRTTTIGVDFASSTDAIALAEMHDHLFAAVGLHPVDNRSESFDPELYQPLALHPKVVAVGECGLDYYRIDPDDPTEKERQRAAFEAQIAFAREYDLPLMLHGRPSRGTMDAYLDMIAILQAHADQSLRGDVHFFVGDLPVARAFLDLNFNLSFTGIVTFARDYDEVIRFVPGDMLHAETDSPFATPMPHRGKRAEPLHVPLVVRELARIRGEDAEMLRSRLLQNAARLFPKAR
jgi:TatD DNase family protein